MSEIHFSADLDSSKLEAAIKQSNQTIKDWSKDVEKSGGQVDQSFSKLGISLKQSIQEQKEYIKGLTKEVREMQKAFDDAAAGQGKQTIGNELIQAKRRLSEATGELIGMQNEQIATNNAEKESADSLTGTIGKWALSLGGAAMILNTLKTALLETTGGLNLFNQIGAITKQVLNDIVTGVGVSMANIRNAIQVQSALNAMRLDESVETFKAAQHMNEYQKLYIQAIDQSLTKTERLKFIDAALAEHNKAIDIEVEHTKKQIDLTAQLLISQPGSDKLKLQYGALFTTLENLETQRNSQTKRLASQRSGIIKDQNDEEIALHDKLIKAWHDEIEVANKVWEERNDIGKKIAEQQKMLNDAIGDGNEKEAKDIAAKIVLLEAELKARENLINAAIMDATVKEAPLSKIKGLKAPILLPGGLKAPSALAGAPVTSEGDYIPGTTMLSKQGWANQKKDANEYDKDREEATKRELRLRQKILDAAMDLTMQIAKQAGLSEEAMAFMSKGMDSISALAKGDLPGAAVNALSLIVSTLSMGTETFEKSLESMENRLKEINKVLDASSEKGGERKAMEDKLKALKSEVEVANNEMLYAEYQLRHATMFNRAGRLAAIDTAETNLEEVKKQLSELEDEYNIFLRGGVTGNTIADVIAQGFQEGKISVADFADYMNSILTDAVMNIFKAEILGDNINAVKDQITAALKDKILTQKEKADINTQVSAIANANKELWNNLTDALNIGGNTTTNNGISMGIQRSITEETGSELAGLFRRFADDNRQTKDYTLLGLNNLTKIEANTYNTVVELQKAVTELQAINSNTKQAPVAGF